MSMTWTDFDNRRAIRRQLVLLREDERITREQVRRGERAPQELRFVREQIAALTLTRKD